MEKLRKDAEWTLDQATFCPTFDLNASLRTTERNGYFVVDMLQEEGEKMNPSTLLPSFFHLGGSLDDALESYPSRRADIT
jgi:hypothetical protein